jgi:hypothetical protein
MTEVEWLQCKDPVRLLDHVRGKSGWRRLLWRWVSRRAPRLSGRKLRLYACACVRQSWRNTPDKYSRRAIDIAEREADGRATVREMAAALTSSGLCTTAAACVVGQSALFAAYHAGDYANLPTGEQAALLRDVLGNPFARLYIDPAWRTPEVVKLTEALYEAADFGRLPKLATALAAAGCTDEAILDHCRASGPHVRGCWVVDLILQRE